MLCKLYILNDNTIIPIRMDTSNQFLARIPRLLIGELADSRDLC